MQGSGVVVVVVHLLVYTGSSRLYFLVPELGKTVADCLLSKEEEEMDIAEWRGSS